MVIITFVRHRYYNSDHQRHRYLHEARYCYIYFLLPSCMSLIFVLYTSVVGRIQGNLSISCYLADGDVKEAMTDKALNLLNIMEAQIRYLINKMMVNLEPAVVQS